MLWPETGFTKGQLIDYYARVADVMVPHLQGRPITLRRWPNGVDAASFYEKNCPSHRPPWVDAVRMGDVNYCLLDEPATLVWVANLAAIELHPSLATAADLDSPTSVVFDLDPGPPADVLDCARVALLVREVLGRLGLAAVAEDVGQQGPAAVPAAQRRGHLRPDQAVRPRRGPAARAGPSGAGGERDGAFEAEGKGVHRLESEHRVEDHGGGVLGPGLAAAERVNPGHVG